MRRLRFPIVPVLAAVLGFTACESDEPKDQPNDPAETPTPSNLNEEDVLQSVNQNLRAVLSGAAQSSEFNRDSYFLGWLFPESADCNNSECADTLEDLANRAADDVRQRVLDVSTVESTTPDLVTVKMDPTLFCEPTSEEPQTECVDILTNAQIRIAISSLADDNYDLQFWVGAQAPYLNPLSMEVAPEQISAEAHLADLQTTLELFRQEAGDTSSFPELSLTGDIESEIVKITDENYESRWNVTSPIRAEWMSDDGVLVLDVAAASPAVALGVNASQETSFFELGFGAIDFSLPLAFIQATPEVCTPIEGTREVNCVPGDPVEGELSGAIPAVTARIDFATSDRIELTGAGLGSETTEILLDGAALLQADINAAEGRVFDGALQNNADDLQVEFDSPLSIATEWAFSLLEGKIEDIPEWLKDETLEFNVSGTGTPTALFFDEAFSSESEHPEEPPVRPEVPPEEPPPADERPEEPPPSGERPEEPPPPPADGDSGDAPPRTDGDRPAPDPFEPPPAEPRTLLQMTSGQLELDSRILIKNLLILAPACLIDDPSVATATPTLGSEGHPLDTLISGACGQESPVP